MNTGEELKYRFCTSCQAYREEATGIFKQTNKTRRWICRACCERKTVSIYRSTSNQKTTQADVRRAFQRVG